MNKDDIRRRVKARKRLLTEIERNEAASRVFEQLERIAAFALSNNILIYNSLPDELSTRGFIDKWSGSKRFFLPRVNGVDLDLLPYEKTSLKMGAFHIEEPTGDDISDPREMELIIVPAVAYDRSGNRIGRGKGFYDRLLPRSNAYRIGVAYDFQLFDELEVDEMDVPVDMVITETSIIVRKKSTRDI
ncbi:MAG: 5-formyltetrahydrofolate cyclo-ligase [Bacteroides sp.]|nr:5-formyltetrahydrofolate cyclo-ligase [Bacteroides sp.]MCM1477854.1 5-formyltetrahydrofolate cyclo-ligase [Bacteroides sp.]